MQSNLDLEDGDNRTRNAKAQRRHREKRKAHLKTLEEQNQILTAELDAARRQLGAGGYSTSGRMAGGPHSPDPRDYSSIIAENSFLRDENADLRRQLYSLRSHYGHQGGSGGAGGGPEGERPGWDVKHEPFGAGYSQGQSILQSPRLGSSHGRMHDLPIPNSAAESSSSSSSYPPALDHYPPHANKNSRGRVTSSSSAPSASPYLPPTPQFSALPTDPRAHALNMDNSRSAPLRYETQMYPQPPPPHSLPRSHSSLQYPHSSVDTSPGHYQRHDQPDGSMAWGPDAGPPPFGSSVSSYALGFQNDPPSHNNPSNGNSGATATDLEDWRANH